MKPNTLIFGHDDKVAAWVAKQIPHVGSVGFGPCRAIAVCRGNNPVAGIVYHDWQEQHGTCQISMASVSPFWAQPQTIRDLLAIPFDQYRCQRVWTCIPADNVRALRFNAGIGMVREGILRRVFGRGRHGHVYGMTVEEYRDRWCLKEAA